MSVTLGHSLPPLSLHAWEPTFFSFCPKRSIYQKLKTLKTPGVCTDMARFLISNEVAELLPRMQIVVVTARGIDNAAPNPGVAAQVQVQSTHPAMLAFSRVTFCSQ